MIFLLWTAIIAYGSFFAVLPSVRKDNIPLLVMCFLSAFYACLLGIFTLLGLIGALSPGWMTIGLAVAAVLLRARARAARADGGSPALLSPGSLESRYFIPLAGVLAVYHILVSYAMFLPPLTTDGLLYHLPFAVNFLKTNSASYCPLYFTQVEMAYYPQGGSFLYLFGLYHGLEPLFKFTQLPFALAGGLAVYLLASREGYPRVLCVGAVCVFALLKPVLAQSTLSYVDLVMTSSFLVSLYCFSGKNGRLVLPGLLSAGICAATKSHALIFLLLLAPFLLRLKKSDVPARELVFGLCFLVFAGGSTYLRNLFLLGNPFFPAVVEIAGFTVFDGIAVYGQSSFARSLGRIAELFMNPLPQVDAGGWTSAGMFVFLGVSLILSFRKDRNMFFIFLLVPASIALYALAVPFFYLQTRHLLPLYGILALACAYPFKHAGKFRGAVFVLPAFFVLEALPRPFLMARFLLLWPVFYAAFYFPSVKKKRFSALAAPAVLSSILLLWNLHAVLGSYGEDKYRVWNAVYGEEAGVWEFVGRHSQEGRNIAYAGQFLLYPFYGEGYRNDVYYQSVNSVETRPVHDYGGKFLFEEEDAASIYRRNPSFELWLEGLKRKRTDWIVIRNEGAFPERLWAEENEDIFTKIFSNGFACVYEMAVSRQGLKAGETRRGGY